MLVDMIKCNMLNYVFSSPIPLKHCSVTLFMVLIWMVFEVLAQ